MFFSSRLVVCIATLQCFAAAAPAVVAAPTTTEDLDKRWMGNDRFWQHSEGHLSFIDFTRRQANDDAAGKCNLRSAQQPVAPTPLPAPSQGLFLSHVAIGRGTQNYTCNPATPSAAPTAAGALATLFNVSCVAADQPSLLAKLPNIALNLPIPSPSDKASAAYNDMSGHHYFTDATTAFFNLDTTLHDYGEGSFKKLFATAPPADASPGQYNKGDGAVAWLKLGAKNPAGQTMQEVYRLNTAGGNPPKTCEGAQPAFQVEYAAEYWFYSK